MTIANNIGESVAGVQVQLLGNSYLALVGNNSYSGGTTVSGLGTLGVVSNTALGTGVVTLEDGTLQGAAPNLAISNNFRINNTAAGSTIESIGFPVTLSGNITDGSGGSGKLTIVGFGLFGSVIMAGTNTYSGGTTICACATLQLGTLATQASIVGAVTNEGIFDIVNANTSGIASVTNELGGVTIFRNSTSAGTMTIDNETGGSVEFRVTSSAGTATINNAIGSSTNFFNDSTADNATINNVAGGIGTSVIAFSDFSRGGTATINNAGFGFVVFNDRATLENARIINRDDGLVFFNSQSIAGTALASISNHDFGQVHFLDRSSAGSATITNTDSGVLDFANHSTAGDAVIINSSTFGMAFLNQSTAGNAFITTSNNSATFFFGRSDGGTARFETEAGSVVDFSGSRGPDNDRRINAGSIGGAGSYYIGANNTLITGGNNRSSEVSGVIADFDPCGCSPAGPGALEKVGSGAMILSGVNIYTGTTGVFGGVLDIEGSIASSSLTTVNANAVLMGAGTVGNSVIASGGIFRPGNATPGSSMMVAGNLAFQSGALYLVQLNSTTSTFAVVTGISTLNGTVGTSFAAGSIVLPRYAILTAAGGHSGAFAGVDPQRLPAGFVATLSYDPTHAYLDLVLDYAAKSKLNVDQQNVNRALGSFFNANGSIPVAFAGLSSGGLSQVAGETATGSQQATFDAMNQFLGVLTDPLVAGRGGFGSASGGVLPFAETFDSVNAYAAKRPAAARDAFAKFPTKADVARNDLFDPRWSVWGAAYGGGSSTDGNTALGSNTATARAFGFAAGADYRISPATLAGFALAGGGTSFAVNGFGSGRSDLFQAGAFVRHTIGPAYVTVAAAYAWQDVTTDRTVTVAGIDRLRAQFNANAWSGRVEGGYRFVAPWMGVTPYAAGQFTTYQLPAYAEQVVSGANTFALNYAARDVTASRSELGIRTDKSFAIQNTILTLRGRAAWAHNFNTDRSITPVFQTLPGAAFVVNGAAQARDAALTTASAEMKWLNGWSAAATFEGEFSEVTRSYAGKGLARYTW
ncbi:MAG: autotransporter domain-containing protein [Pseudomonadota bacterium]